MQPYCSAGVDTEEGKEMKINENMITVEGCECISSLTISLVNILTFTCCVVK